MGSRAAPPLQQEDLHATNHVHLWYMDTFCVSYVSKDEHHCVVCILQAQLKEGREEVQRLKAALLDQEAVVLHRDRQLADLRKQLKDERRKAEAPLQMDQAIQAEPVQYAHLEVQVCCLV